MERRKFGRESKLEAVKLGQHPGPGVRGIGAELEVDRRLHLLLDGQGAALCGGGVDLYSRRVRLFPVLAANTRRAGLRCGLKTSPTKPLVLEECLRATPREC